MQFIHKFILCFCLSIFPRLLLAVDVYEEKMARLIVYAKAFNPDLPFAAMIVETKTGKEICRGINHSTINPTMHGEIVAINDCLLKFGPNKIEWSHLTLITTAEPCPMCQSAIIWAGFGRVVFGTSNSTSG